MAQAHTGLTTTPEGLCDRCASITFEKVASEDRLRPPKFIYILHRTRESYRKSLDDGCKFCLLLSSQLRKTESVDDECKKLNAFIVLQCRIPRGTWSFGAIMVFSHLGSSSLSVIGAIPGKYRNAVNKASSTTPILPQPDEEREEETTTQRVAEARDHSFEQQGRKRKRSQPGSSVGNRVQRDDEHNSTGSKANMRLANLWIQDCVENHDGCKRDSTSYTEPRLPKRLLNIKDPQSPFIIDVEKIQQDIPQDYPPRYVALSYSWGPDKVYNSNHCTTEKTQKDHETRVPPHRISRTICDAIKTASALGFSYIWVDALCIIQGHKEDLDGELPHMGNTYRRAELTIYAEGSRSNKDGLFRTRDSHTYHPCEIRVTLPAEDDEPPHCPTLMMKAIIATEDHLSKRGWVLQEEISTSRCLMFGERQMRWRCMQAFADETGLCPVPKPASGRALNVDTKPSAEDKLRELLFYSPGKPQSKGPDRGDRGFGIDPCDMWYRVVERYGSRELSNPNDTLPAVSGLATLFREAMENSEQTRDELVAGRYDYVQGLWKGDLAVGLAWYVEAEVRVPGWRRETTRQDHRIATWSWPSVGKVDIRFRGWKKYHKSCDELAVKLVGVECLLDSEDNPNGPAKRGTLELKARLRRARIRDPAEYRKEDSEKHATRSEYPRFSAIVVDSEDSTVILGEAALDTRLHACLEPDVNIKKPSSNNNTGRFEMDVSCMLLHVQRPELSSGFNTRDTPCRLAALVLREEEEGGKKYRRLGFFFPKDVPYDQVKSLFPIEETVEIT